MARNGLLCANHHQISQIKFISLKNSIQYTSGIIAVSGNSKAKVALTAVLDRPTNITGLHINY